MSSDQPLGQRAARGEGRDRLLGAALELFSSRPYDEVGTKEIAERAGVTEPMLFRHFGTKRGLFKEATFAPVDDFLTAFIRDWEQRPRGRRDPLDEARDLYRGLYDTLVANRRLVRTLIAVEALGGDGDGAGAPPIGAILQRFERLTVRERDVHDFRRFDPTILTHIMFGMVLSIAIHGDWIRAGSDGPTPDADAYIDEMAQLTVYGLTHEHPR